MTVFLSLESPNWVGDITVDKTSYNASVYGVRVAGYADLNSGLVLKPGKKPLEGSITSVNDLNELNNHTIGFLQEALIIQKIPMTISIEIAGYHGWPYKTRKEWKRDVVIDLKET